MRKRLSISQKVDKFRQLRYFVLSCGDIRNLHATGAESKKERNRRFQKLCRVGGTVEKYFPEILEFYPNELDEFFYSLFFFSDEVRQYIFDFIARSNFKQNQSVKGGGASG